MAGLGKSKNKVNVPKGGDSPNKDSGLNRTNPQGSDSSFSRMLKAQRPAPSGVKVLGSLDK